MPSDDGTSIHSTTGSEASGTSAFLMAEMDQPWPSTYERSISLLASPIINADRVNLGMLLVVYCSFAEAWTRLSHRTHFLP